MEFMRRLSSCAIKIFGKLQQQGSYAALVIVRNHGIRQVATARKGCGACHRAKLIYLASSQSKEGMRRLSLCAIKVFCK